MNDQELGNIKAVVDENSRKIDKLIYLMEGNGTPGLKTRIDRLERLASGAAWLFGLVGGPALVAAFALIIHWIRTGGKLECPSNKP